MLTQRKKRSLASTHSRSRSHRNRQRRVAQFERLEDRRLLSVTVGGPDDPHFEFPDELRQWRVERGTAVSTELHHGPQGSFEFVWEPLPTALNTSAGESGTGGESGSGGALIPIGSIPALHSNPDAPASLFLDFDGHFEPEWGAYSNATTPVYDIDGDVTTFDETELSRILTAWEMVTEDFAPFNIDVTTVEPAVLADGVPDNQADGVALRVAIGGSWEDWYGKSVGGVAYIDSFTSSIPNVAYVFSKNTSTLFGKMSAHEAGHGFGLHHQSLYDAAGNLIQEYYSGTSTWQPTMGGGATNLSITSTWHNGTSSEGPYVYQDDMAILAGATNGFGYRSDDHADTDGGATALSTDGTTWSGAGIIETNNDVDVFNFSTAQEDTYRVSNAVADVAPNLDAVLELRAADGTLIASADPQETLSAAIVESLAAGDYFVAVTKTDKYGWVGQYGVTVDAPGADITVTPASAPLHTGENGTAATFDVVLYTKPTDAVTVPLSSSNPAEATLSISSLTFTPMNWNVPQTVTVTGMDDAVVDGHAAYNIIVGPATSGDPEYDGLDPNDVPAVNLDNDRPGWAFQLSSLEDIYAYDVNVGPDGNIYLQGRFRGSVDFDPGPATESLTAQGSNGELFIAKYTPATELLWVRRFGGVDAYDYARKIDFDAAGNVYSAGYYYSTTATFGALTVTNQGSADAYLTKLDADGNFLWVRSWGGPERDDAEGLSVDDNGVVHVAGDFSSTVDFDPGPGVVQRTSQGSTDGYLASFDSNGGFLAVLAVGGSASDSARSVANDSAGNVYLAGNFQETAQFGTSNGTTPVELTSAGSSDSFLLQVTPAGDTAWIRQATSPSSASLAEVGFDGLTGIYFTGRFSDTMDFGPGSPSLTSGGSSDAFISKWDIDGNLLWTGQIQSSETNRINDLAFDADGAPHFIGYFNGTADLDPGTGTAERTSLVGQDTFVLQLGSDGSFQQVEQIVQDATSSYRAVSIDAGGNIYVTGDFRQTVILPTGHLFTAPESSKDAYLLKLTTAPGISINPTTGLLTGESGGSATFTVVLDLPPTADVSIGFASSDLGEGSVSPASLTFTPSNWNVPQTVTVTGTDDALIDGDIAYTIITAAAVSDDLEYRGLRAADVAVTNLDDDQPITLFHDSFEVGTWNGLWLEDSQDDWFRSTQRSVDGNYSAEVDGRATDATLTWSNSVDLTPYGSAELSFSWFIERGFDSGEYLALDLFDGTAWNEIAKLRGNVDQENVWHQETIDIGGSYLVDDFKIRFRAKASWSNEDGNVDNVQFVATSLAAPPNQPPVAASDEYSVEEDTSLNVSAPGVLTNDSDADGDSITALLVADATHGAVALNANGAFTYTPGADYNGSDSFTYKVNDGTSDSNVATVNITVTPVNDTPDADDQSLSTGEDSALAITLTGSDIDGDLLTYQVVSGPGDGTLSGTIPNLTYTPNANFNGADSFTFVANDGTVDSNVATVTIHVAANRPPVADGQSVNVNEDGSLAITLSGSDLDGDPITYAVVSSPTSGALTGTGPNLTYTPGANYNGGDSFTFKVNDGTDDSAVATVSITVTPVSDAPVADAQSVSTSEDTPLGITLTGSDIDGDSLSYVVVIGPASGALTGTGPSRTYTPGANYNGSDSFTFKVNDGTDDSAVATVLITVTPVNDAPVASGDAYTLDQDTSLNVAAPGVLGNDSDVEGDTISAVLEIGPSNGSLTLNSDGSFDYTPSANYVGADSFSYKATDGSLSSNVVTVSLTVDALSAGPNLAHGVVANVGSSGWTTVPLSRVYTDMLVIATPNYDSSDAPGVVRIQNASGSSFDVRVDSAGGAALSGIDVHYVVVEAGVYDEPGYKMEAVTFTSTVTDENNSWAGQSRTYQQSYSNPVVVGQVMSYNDSDWSVFWAAGSSRKSIPSSSELRVGKHVGEDSDTTRADETIGYIVIETSASGTATIEGSPYVAAVGADSIKGVGDSPSYAYSYNAMPNSKTAIASQAGMDGVNGGWAVLYGSNPITPTGNTLKLAVDEDQDKDSERRHTTEQVAYFLIDPPVAAPPVAADPLDSSGAGIVSPWDALLVPKELNSNPAEVGQPAQLDVNGDTVPAALQTDRRRPPAADMRHQVGRDRIARQAERRDQIAMAQGVEVHLDAPRHRMVDRIFGNNTNWLR